MDHELGAYANVEPAEAALPHLEAPAPHWPPPGLERMHDRLGRIVERGAVGSLLLVLPLASLLTLEAVSSFDSAILLAPVLLSLVGAALVIAALVALIRLLWRAREALGLGYGWATLLEVLSDGRREAGDLQGGTGRYARVGPGTRSQIRLLRVASALTATGAALWPPVGLVAAVALAGRDVAGPLSIWALPLGPGLALGLAALAFSVGAGTLRRAAEESAGAAAADDLTGRVRAWQRSFGPTDRPAGFERRRAGRAAAVGAATAAALAAVGVAALAGIMAAASVQGVEALMGAGYGHGPGNLLRAEIEIGRAYRVPVEAAVTADDAGRALRALLSVGGGPAHPHFRPAEVPHDEPWPAEPGGGPIGVLPELWDERLIGMARAGLSPVQLDYLRRYAAHPALRDFETLARAGELDVTTALYRLPFPEGMGSGDLPVPPPQPLHGAAHAQVARAAVAVADGRWSEAETALRETISVGVLLADRGNTPIENRIGLHLARTGLRALAGLYPLTGRAPEAARIEGALGTVAAARKADGAVLRGRDAMAHARVAGHPDAPRGMRWQSARVAGWLSDCSSVRDLVFEPKPVDRERIESLRETLVRGEGDRALYELIRNPPAPPSARRPLLGAMRLLLGPDAPATRCPLLLAR